MEKILTVSIAGYNVEGTIRQTLDSLLVEQVIGKLDIIVNDDGGTDGTVAIAEEYRKRYPDSIRIVHKENGGYGSVINTNLALAEGKYFKQLDGDDWFESKQLERFIDLLEKTEADCILTRVKIVNDHLQTTKIANCYTEIEEGFHRFDETDFQAFLTMHSVTFRTKAVQNRDIHITEHCFYTDTEYVNSALPYVDTFYLYPHVIYVYRRGVEGQSVSWSGRQKHYKEQETVFWKNAETYRRLEEPHKKQLVANRLNNSGRAHLGYFFRFPVSKEKRSEFQAYGRKLHEELPEIETSIKRRSVFWRVIIGSNYRLYLLPRIPVWMKDHHLYFRKKSNVPADE